MYITACYFRNTCNNMNELFFSECQHFPGTVRNVYGDAFFPVRIREVYVYSIKCQFKDFFSPHFKFFFHRLERCMLQDKNSFENRM